MVVAVAVAAGVVVVVVMVLVDVALVVGVAAAAAATLSCSTVFALACPSILFHLVLSGCGTSMVSEKCVGVVAGNSGDFITR